MPRPYHVLGDYYQLLLKNGLLASSAPLRADFTRKVRLVSCTSQHAVPGTLFICKGAAFRPAYLQEAIGKGAFVYVAEHPYAEAGDVPCIGVTDIRAAMALLSDLYWGHPSGGLKVVGITGTKGKTTTAYYLNAILDEWRRSRGKNATALLSSLITYDGRERRPSKLTTPEPLELQRHLYNARRAGCDYLTMEVSSQALKYHRVDGVEFAAALFLNIGEDHISPIEHPDLADYFASKLKIFRQAAAAVVNLDCDRAQEIRAAAWACPQVLTFSRRDPSADVYAGPICPDEPGVRFPVRTPRWEREIRLPMTGSFNVENALAAIAAAQVLGVPESAVYNGLSSITVPGRMETYHSACGALSVVVDYAHNGMSLEALLSTVHEHYPDRSLTVVFGCVGSKALDRREGMAAAAGRWADRIVLTEDDPGKEDVEAICAHVAQLLAPWGKAVDIIPDRELAVDRAVMEVRAPTVVVLAGKGAENVQKRKNGPEPCVPDGLLAQRALARFDANLAVFDRFPLLGAP